MITTNGTVKKGRLVLEGPLDLPDGSRVKVQVNLVNEEDDDPLLWLANNAMDLGLTDGAAEHDHYIYGSPKRKRGKKGKRN